MQLRLETYVERYHGVETGSHETLQIRWGREVPSLGCLQHHTAGLISFSLLKCKLQGCVCNSSFSGLQILHTL